jgi:hypothetical protein
MCLDGPTFVDTEGWDWIPAIRDRDTGIWQAVTIKATGAVRARDPQIVTRLPLPDTHQAAVEITVPLQNDSSNTVQGTLTASFESVSVTKTVSVAPGKSETKLSPREFAELTVKSPRLWWPNGYGKPELYTLKLSFSEDGKESDSKKVRFGIREITYEISLLDSTGHLRRVDYSPTAAREKSEQIVDVTHEGIRNIPNADPYPSIFPPEWKEGWKGWVASLRPGAEKSAAVRAVDDTRASPYLTLRVNGVRIAARGGSWGMDDSRKQLDPTTFHVQVANSLPATASGLVIRAKVYSLDNRVLEAHEEKKDAPTGVIDAFALKLGEKLKSDVAFVKLELRDSSEELISDNFYWVGADTAAYRKLNRLPVVQLGITASAIRKTGVTTVHVRLENKGNSAAIETKLTLWEADGRTRILPAYYGDNYISLLPGEIREVDVETPSSAAKTGLALGVRGWNVSESLLQVGGEK